MNRWTCCFVCSIALTSVGYRDVSGAPSSELSSVSPPAVTPDEEKTAGSDAREAGPGNRKAEKPSATSNLQNAGESEWVRENETRKTKNQQSWEWGTVPDWAVAGFTGVLLIFTFFQVLYMRGELAATKAAAEAAIQTVDQMRLEQRAWFVVLEPQILEEISRNNPFKYSVPVINTGKLPGALLRIRIGNIFGKTGDDVDEMAASHKTLLVKDRDRTMIAPGTTHQLIPDFEKLDGGLVHAVEEQEMRMMVVIELDYSDSTDGHAKVHKTMATYAYDAKRKRLFVVSTNNFMT